MVGGGEGESVMVWWVMGEVRVVMRKVRVEGGVVGMVRVRVVVTGRGRGVGCGMV